MTVVSDYLGAALVAEYDARQLVFSNDAGSTPSADGGVVACWGAVAGSNQLPLKQTINALRPLYRSSWSTSGKPAIEFDGVNDNLVITGSGAVSNFAKSGGVTILSVLEWTGSGTQSWVGRATGSNFEFAYLNPPSSQTTTSGGTRVVGTGTGTLLLRGIAIYHVDLASGRIWNALADASGISTVATGTTMASQTADWNVGTYNGTTFPFKGAYHWLAICDVLTTTQIRTVTTYLESDWGISTNLATAKARPLSRILNTGA